MTEMFLPRIRPAILLLYACAALVISTACEQRPLIAQTQVASPLAGDSQSGDSQPGSPKLASPHINSTSWYERKSQWHGFDQFHFRVTDRPAYLVRPKVALAGRPWIWRARFPGYHAEMDVKLVGKGFHLAYLDVANMFGSPQAMKAAKVFYDNLVQQQELSLTPILEGVSRGGLFVYNWAAKYPHTVAGIYCDTPVLDFGSWPGGHGDGVGSTAAWKACLNAYGMTEADAKAFRKQPIHKAAVIASAKIPILHIVSENDRVVPPKENSYRMRKELRANGHDMAVISVSEGTEKSNGHHFEHPDPDRVVDFIRSCIEKS